MKVNGGIARTQPTRVDGWTSLLYRRRAGPLYSLDERNVPQKKKKKYSQESLSKKEDLYLLGEGVLRHRGRAKTKKQGVSPASAAACRTASEIFPPPGVRS